MYGVTYEERAQLAEAKLSGIKRILSFHEDNANFYTEKELIAKIQEVINE